MKSGGDERVSKDNHGLYIHSGRPELVLGDKHEALLFALASTLDLEEHITCPKSRFDDLLQSLALYLECCRNAHIY